MAVIEGCMEDVYPFREAAGNSGSGGEVGAGTGAVRAIPAVHYLRPSGSITAWWNGYFLREGDRENRTSARSGTRPLYSIRFRRAYGVGSP